MIPAGYLLKRVSERPASIHTPAVNDIYSVSGCMSENFADYINHWRHNGYWLFNRPSDMDAIVEDSGADRSNLALFYYEVYEREFDEDEKAWSTFEPEASLPTDVAKPSRARLVGFDVTSFSAGTSPECSPLSCNAVADEIAVNEHCLFATFEEAKAALESGAFENCELGPYRIFAVYTVES